MRVPLRILCCLSGLLLAGAASGKVVDGSDGVNMGSNQVYNLGFIDLSAVSNDFTDVEVGCFAISAGQLCGINPETGEIITNAVSLLPILVRSAYVAGEVNASLFTGDGSGLTNLWAGNLTGRIPLGTMPTSGVWNVSGLTLQNANFEGALSVEGQSLDIGSDLNVQGTLSGNASGLSNVPAGGEDGSIQFNSAGQLEGNTNYFIHAQTGKLACNSQEGNLFRAYGESVSAEGLIYVVRSYRNTTELCLLSNGEETVRLRGDGTAYFSGSVEIGGDISFANGMKLGNNNNWYIPENGDLSMGSYTQQ